VISTEGGKLSLRRDDATVMAAIYTARAGHAFPVRPLWRLRTARTARLRALEPSWSRRLLQTSSSNPPKPPDFAFAFE